MSGMTRKPLTSAALHQVIIRTSGSVARSCSFAGGRPGHKRSDRIPKYVASRTLTEVGWQNAQLLGPDVPAAVQKLRAEPGGEIHVWGSAELIKALAEQNTQLILRIETQRRRMAWLAAAVGLAGLAALASLGLLLVR